MILCHLGNKDQINSIKTATINHLVSKALSQEAFLQEVNKTTLDLTENLKTFFTREMENKKKRGHHLTFKTVEIVAKHIPSDLISPVLTHILENKLKK